MFKNCLAALALLFSASALQAQSNWANLTVGEKPVLEIASFRGGDFGLIEGIATLSGGTIAVADSRNFQIYLFNPNGELRKTFGREGAGPGEFKSIKWVGRCGEGDTLMVEDLSLDRLTGTDASGRTLFIRQLRTQLRTPSGVSVFVPEALHCGSGKRQVQLGTGMSITSDATGSYRPMVPVVVSVNGVNKQLGTFPGIERFRYPTTYGPRMLGKQTLVAATPTRVYVGAADSFYVERYDYDGALQGTIRGPKGVVAKLLTPADREEWLRFREQKLRPGIDRKENTQRVREQLARYNDFPRELPVYRRFLVEGEKLWVEEGHRPTESTRTWWGFDSLGQVFARLVLPESLEIFEIRKEEVLGKWTDSEGVESVRRYRTIQNAR